jgi:Subtilase family
MLIRRSAGLLTTVVLIGLTPPLMDESRAGTSDWAVRFARDVTVAEGISRGRSVKIALLSDGVAPGVRSLKGALEKEKDLVGTPRPRRAAGTLMASLIIGGTPAAGSPVAIRGLAPAATILPVRVYADPGDPGERQWQESADWGKNLSNAIRYAVDHGADVITVDAYDADRTQAGLLSAAITYAQTKDVVIVAPVGVRKAGDPAHYPGSAPGVIGVGALTEKGRRDKKLTSRSSAALVSAPGVTMPSIGPDNRLWTFWGDPVALAFTTGAVAMIRSEYPKLTPAQVGQALSASARRPGGKGRYDTELGFGYLNPAGALDEARKLAGGPGPAMTAASSVPDKTRLGGDRPDTIRAVPYRPLRIGGFGGLAVAGLVAIGLAAWLALRRRSAPAEPSEPVAT